MEERAWLEQQISIFTQLAKKAECESKRLSHLSEMRRYEMGIQTGYEVAIDVLVRRLEAVRRSPECTA